MFCTKCGQQNDDNVSFCTNCGAPLNSEENTNPQAQPVQPEVQPPQQPQYQAQAPQSQPNAPVPGKGLGIASMVLGIISVVICCCYGIGLLLAIPGLILGLVAKKSPETGKRSGFALAGIIISSISIGLNLIWLIYMIYVIISNGINDYSNYSEFWKQFQDEFGSEYDMFTKL